MNRVKIEKDSRLGIATWLRDGKKHRGNDLPAVICNNPSRKEWWVDGKLHRATLDRHGYTLPAVEYSTGRKEWWRYGSFIRSNGLHSFEDTEGKYWCLIKVHGETFWLPSSYRDETDENGHVLPSIEHANGKKEWYLNGKLHRENDLPAIICPSGNQEWWVNGERHRESKDEQGKDLPAIIWSNSFQAWYVNGKLHRDNDLPAVTWPGGRKEWWVNGERHRDNDLPAIIWSNGNQEWWVHGKRHRDNDLPAIIYSDGKQEWWVNGELHRDSKDEHGNDLPAIIYSDGRREWYKNGVYLKTCKKEPLTDNCNLTVEQEGTNCPICFVELSGSCHRTKCAHLFHSECLSLWKSGTCPMCRRVL